MRLPFFISLVTALMIAAWANAQVPSPSLVGSQDPSSRNSPPAPEAPAYFGNLYEPGIDGPLGNLYSLLPFRTPDRIWGSAEYLMWWIRDGRLPPLVTSSPAGTPFGAADVLGQSTTKVLLGDGAQGMGMFAGGRFTLGYWLAPGDSGVGVEAGGFFLGKRTDSFSTSSDSSGNPPIGRPYISAFTGTPQSYTVSFGQPSPFATGSVNASLFSEMWGTEFNLVFAAEDTGASHRTWLLGFRYAELGERLSIVQNTNLLPGNGILFAGNTVVLAPDGVSLSDTFATLNQFYGAQVGVRQTYDFGRFNFGAAAKIAVGSVHQTVDIEGTSAIVSGGVETAHTKGGLLAVDTNIGRRTQDRFAVLPEVNLKFGYKLSECLTAFAGYDLMYLSSVVRPGDQIDRTINLAHVPTDPSFGTAGGPNSPAPQFNRTDFWAQGITFGVLFKF